MENCYEYLLTVAQKIMTECAEKKTIEKYLSLKHKLINKYTIQTESSHLAFSTLNQSNYKSSAIKTSLVDSGSNKQSRCHTRQSISKTKSKEKGLTLSKARVQSYSSKGTDRSNLKTLAENKDEYNVLLHMATVIKNAESCPSMLKTVTFSPNSFEPNVNCLIESIAASLTVIYRQLTLDQQKEASQPQRASPEHEQLIRDNKWLMSKLGAVVDENSILRRMVGHRIY